MTVRSTLSSEPGSKEVIQTHPWRELTTLLLVVMELSWLVPSYCALSGLPRSLPRLSVYGFLGGLLLLSYLSSRLMNTRGYSVWVRRAVLLALMTGSGVVALKFLLYAQEMVSPLELIRRIASAFADLEVFIPAEFEVLLVVLLIWPRGVMLSQWGPNDKTVMRSFRTGAIVLLFLSLFNLMPWDEKPGLEIYVFLLTGLLGMATGRISTLGRLRGGRSSPFERTWLLGMVLGAGLIVVLSLIFAIIASLHVASVATRLAFFVAQILLILFMILLSPLMLLILVMVPGLFDRLQELLDISGMQDHIGRAFQALIDLLRKIADLFRELWRSIPDLGRFKPFLLWGLILLGILFLLRLLGRSWRFGVGWREGEDQREFILAQDDLAKRLREAIDHGARQLKAGLRNLRHGRGLLGAARIRRIYSRMMKMCEDLDSPRRAAQTPLEFLPTVKGLFPDQSDDLDTITEAYMRIRYGELPETRQEVSLVTAAWERVREHGEQLRAERQKALK